MVVRRRKLDNGPARGDVRSTICVRSRLIEVIVAASVICSLVVLGPTHMSGQDDDDAEYRVKLAFLFNFAQFVEWPADDFSGANSPLEICVAGPNPFTGVEQEVRGRRVAGHPIEIKRLKADDDPRVCQMVFVRARESKWAGRILAAVRTSDTLTVGEAKGFALRGGAINFTAEGNRLRFEINVNATTRSRLKISSKLLALARIVGGAQHTSSLAKLTDVRHGPDSATDSVESQAVPAP
jgi:hypothetical protein